MGLYRDQILPRLVDHSCAASSLNPWRAKVTKGLTGRVVEIGFGSGLNAGFYPAEVQLILAVEPKVVRKLADKRMTRSGVAVEHVGADGESIPLDDNSCDSALSSFALCTIPDAQRALEELRRVLRPGARLHFLEHGIAVDPAVVAWQRRLDPWQCRLTGGCHLARDPVGMVGEAGFRIDSVEQGYVQGPRPWSWLSVGTATKL